MKLTPTLLNVATTDASCLDQSSLPWLQMVTPLPASPHHIYQFTLRRSSCFGFCCFFFLTSSPYELLFFSVLYNLILPLFQYSSCQMWRTMYSVAMPFFCTYYSVLSLLQGWSHLFSNNPWFCFLLVVKHVFKVDIIW